MFFVGERPVKLNIGRHLMSKTSLFIFDRDLISYKPLYIDIALICHFNIFTYKVLGDVNLDHLVSIAFTKISTLPKQRLCGVF